MQISFLTFWWAHAKVSSSSSSTKAKLAQTLFRFMRFDKLWLHLMCAYGVTCPFHVTPLATRAKKLDTLTQPRHSFLLATDTQFPVGISISVDMSSGFVGLAVGVDVAGCHCHCAFACFLHAQGKQRIFLNATHGLRVSISSCGRIILVSMDSLLCWCWQHWASFVISFASHSESWLSIDSKVSF